jgi:hypothetical protein
MSISAKTKQPSLRRELIISELVISDLKEMDQSGGYDLNVLLWLQDGYVNRAIKAYLPELQELQVGSGKSPKEIRRQQMRALVDFTCAIYANEKDDGQGGVDLKRYIDAAQTFFETELAHYGGSVKEIAEYIKKSSENGEKLDIERYARDVYISSAMLSRVMKYFEKSEMNSVAVQVEGMLKQSFEEIGAIRTDSPSINVGQKLLELVVKIGLDPRAYIEFHDPSIEMPKREPWDYKPMQRQDEYNY